MSDAARMRWACADVPAGDPVTAAANLASALRAQLDEGPVDLCLVFVASVREGALDAITEDIQGALEARCIAAASARGTIGREHEVEQGAHASAIAARLPGVEISPFLVVQEIWAEPVADEAAFDRIAPGARGAELVILLGDPFSLDMERVLGLFNRFAPGVRVVGGMASAGVRPGTNALGLNDWRSHEGAVAIALRGALRADVVVSQGCAPVGPPLDVTHVERNVLLTLDGQPALERIEQVLGDLAESDRARLEQGLYVGRPARGDASGPGDYLIRNLLGADRERGAVAVGDVVGPREKIRLHVRDGRAATEDLELLLSPQAFDTPAAAALVFTCNGRGRMLFGSADRDIATLQTALGGVPAAGMFCAGEVGPVAGRNFMHGHTASIAIVRGR